MKTGSFRIAIANGIGPGVIAALSVAAAGVAAIAGSRPALEGVLMVGGVALATVDGPTDDLERVIEAVERLDEGEYDVTVTAERDDGVGELADAVDDLASTLRERERTEQVTEKYRPRLYRIASDASLDDEVKVRRLLELGCDHLGAASGFVSRIDGSSGRYEIRTVHGSDLVSEGSETDISNTYCRDTVESDDIRSVYDASTADGMDSEFSNVGWYLGGKLTVRGEVYGTLCFVGRDPRDEPFTPAEKAIVGLISRWTGYVFETRERERRFEQYRAHTGKILEAVDDVFYVLDRDGLLRQWNRTLNEVTGYTDAELESMHSLEFFDEPYVDRILSAIETVYEEGHARVEAPLLTKDGEQIPYEFVASELAVRGEDTIIVGIGRDVTDRKKRERKLRERERQLERHRQYTDKILDTIDDMFYVFDEDGALQRWNESLCRVTGYSREEVESMHAREFFVEDDREAVTAAIGRIDEMIGEYLRADILTKDGEQIPYEFVAAPLEDPQGERVIAGIGRDVTEQKERERELKRTKNMLQQSQHLAQVGAWEFDVRDGDTDMAWTDEVYHIHDVPPEEDISVDDGIEFYRSEYHQRVRDAVRDAVENGEEYDLEAKIVTREGNERWVRSIGEPVYEDGEVDRVRGSIQDITEQKERELALKSLHDVAHSLLNTETESEVAGLVADAAGDVLDVDGIAVYLLDGENSCLDPAAYTDGFVDVCDGPSPVDIGDNDSLVWDTFVTRTQTTLDDVDPVDEAVCPTSGNGLLVPLGDHGVFVAVAETTTIDDETRRLVETLAATTEAAFDRLESEAALRERDAELSEQNRRLRRQIGINEIIRSIDRTLIQADSQEAIEETVCERLVDAENISFAWIGGFESGRTELTPRAWAGSAPEYLNALSLRQDDAEPSVAAALSGKSTIVGSVVEQLKAEDWRKHALAADLHSVVSVPLSFGQYDHGVLTVYADEPNAFCDLERTVFEELGRNIANSINAAKTRRALHADTLLELTLRVDALDEFLSKVARETGCQVEYEGLGANTPDQTQLFFETIGADPETVETLLDDLVSVQTYRLVSETADRCRFEATIASDALAAKLVRRGGRPRTIRADGTELEVVVDVPPATSVREFVGALEDDYRSVELVARHDVQRALKTRRDVVTALFEGMTDRQLEVIRTAYFAGFFDWPRESTGEEVAEMLDITQPTVNRHLRVGQQRILSQLFENGRDGDDE